MTNWFTSLFTPAAHPAPGDPFAHPDVARMSHRDLADLPLVPPPTPGTASAQPAAPYRRGRAILT